MTAETTPLDLDGINRLAAEWWGEGNGIAEAADVIAKVPLLVAEVERLRANIDQARRYVEAARQRSMRGESSPVSDLGFNVLAALGEEPTQ